MEPVVRVLFAESGGREEGVGAEETGEMAGEEAGVRAAFVEGDGHGLAPELGRPVQGLRLLGPLGRLPQHLGPLGVVPYTPRENTTRHERRRLLLT